MIFMCVICDEEPGSHSFYLVGLDGDIRSYYTCPAKATKYWDTKGILRHYEELLEANGEHPWIWIFDSEGFDMKHSMQIATARGLINLLKKKYGKHLLEIRIVHPSIYIKSMYTIIRPFLTPDLLQLITWI